MCMHANLLSVERIRRFFDVSHLFPAHEAVGTKLIIGKFCSIGAKAVVVRDVEPYPIAGGNPAREIRRRFSPETIAELLEI